MKNEKKKERTLWNRCQVTASKLDFYYPGWSYEVNLSHLDMFYYDYCILGQMFPYYTYDELISIADKLDRYALGFTETLNYEYCRKLNKYWTTLLLTRKRKQGRLA